MQSNPAIRTPRYYMLVVLFYCVEHRHPLMRTADTNFLFNLQILIENERAMSRSYCCFMSILP